MARKGKSERKDRRSRTREGRDEYGVTRKLGSFLALVAVSVITVVLGYTIGRYVIVNLIADTLGLETAAQTAPSPRGDDSPLGRSASAEVTVNTVTETAPSAGAAAPGGANATTGEEDGGQSASSAAQVAASGGTSTSTGSTGTSGSGSSTGTSTPGSSNTSAAQSPQQTPQASSQQATSTGRVLYRVQVGGYADRASADQLLAALKGTFPDAYVVFGTDFRVQVGAYSTPESANEVAEQLRAQGYTEVHIVPVNR